MAEVSRFRGALNGFNRTDVVNYIESMSAEQQKQLRRLQEENESLRSEKTLLTEKLAEANEALDTLREQDASLAEQVTLLSQQAAELADQAEQARLRAETAEARLAADETEQYEAADEEAEPVNYTALELEAYRRAEQVERNAAARAERVYQQLSALCERAHERYSDAGEEIGALSEDLTSNLDRLQQTLVELRIVFDEAQNAFDELDLPPQD